MTRGRVRGSRAAVGDRRSLWMAAGRCVVAAVALCLALGAGAVIETYEFSSPDLEQRYHQLSQELRCPKCQNQNIADSNAPISQDLRRLVYEQLEAGDSNAQILDSMVARYGEFVRYRPAASGAALWLWLAPAVLLLVGFALLVFLLRRGKDTAGASTGMSEDERRRLDALVGDHTAPTKTRTES